ncbi:MAG: hypothetical protein OXE82_00510, partial [Rhodobacter sp.]|nr:hypothetical protein [Rhodobacter sp.]
DVFSHRSGFEAGGPRVPVHGTERLQGFGCFRRRTSTRSTPSWRPGTTAGRRIYGGTPPEIQSFVTGLRRLVGVHPTNRRSPPGFQKVWREFERLNRTIQVRDALGERRWI